MKQTEDSEKRLHPFSCSNWRLNAIYVLEIWMDIQ